MRKVQAGGNHGDNGRPGDGQLPPTGQDSPQKDVANASDQPHKSLGMCDKHQNRQRHCKGDIRVCAARRSFAPKNRQQKESQAKRQVIVEKANVERPPVSQHGHARKEKPRRSISNRGQESKDAPEKNQYAQNDYDFLRRSESERIAELQQQEIKQDVVPLPGEVESGRLAL